MAVAPALVVSIAFEPPQISIVGPIQESTIHKLNELLPHLATNSCQGRRAPPAFVQGALPIPHWSIELRNQLADETAKLSMMVAILDCLEDEGGWSMRDTHSLTYDYDEGYQFFFTKKSR